MNNDLMQDEREALAGDDREAFEKAVEPYLDTLHAAARRDLQYYRQQGAIQDNDFTVEEIVGEGLIHAWERRDRVPHRMSTRGWLLAVQHRAARGVIARQRRHNQEKVLSLDAPLPTEGAASDSTQEWFWEWYQPDRVDAWEDITPGSEPVDLDDFASEETVDRLDEDARGIAVLHHEFDMPLDEVAFTMGRSLNELAETMNGARVSLRQRLNPDGVDAEGHASPYGAPGQAG